MVTLMLVLSSIWLPIAPLLALASLLLVKLGLYIRDGRRIFTTSQLILDPTCNYVFWFAGGNKNLEVNFGTEEEYNNRNHILTIICYYNSRMSASLTIMNKQTGAKIYVANFYKYKGYEPVPARSFG